MMEWVEILLRRSDALVARLRAEGELDVRLEAEEVWESWPGFSSMTRMR